MRRGILVQKHPIARARHNLAGANDHRPDRHFAALKGALRLGKGA
jgi:hypothetical protein